MRKSLYLASSLILSPKVYAEEEDRPFVWDEASVGDDWGRAVRDFRRDHNFAVLMGQTKTQWLGRTEALPKVDTENSATELTLEYSFHIPWGYGIGYSLGTSSSIQVDQKNSSLETHYRASLPGLELGLVWNPLDKLRFNLGMVYGWERIDGLKISGQPGRLSLTEESLSGKFSTDVFRRLTWAVRIEYEETHFPRDAALGYDLEKTIYRIRIGLLKHLL